MLCPKCNKASTKRERADGKCPQCGRAFRLEPADATWISDYEFEKAIAHLSQKGAHKFTRAQLVCEIERHLVRHKHKLLDTMLAAITANTPVPWVVGGLALALGLMFLLLEISMFGVALLAGGGLLILYAMNRESPEVERARIEGDRAGHDGRALTVVNTYLNAGEVPGLLADKRSLSQTTKREHREFDLHSFGFDRVVVVEGDETVEMLVANRFHFEHNAAIVSFTGYPKHVADIVAQQMKSGHTRAHVFLLHDASTVGYRLAEGWRESGWAKNASITRAGLSPKQVAKVLPVSPSRGGDVPSWVPPAEAAWLRTGSVSIAALRPAQVMTLLFNAMNEVEKRDASGGDIVLVGFDTASDSSYDFG